MSAHQTLLLTDVVDSTKLSQQLGDEAMAGLWALHDHVARKLLRIWRGREIDKSDGFLLLFDSVADGLGYAEAYHQALGDLNPPMLARAGLHLGKVALRENPVEDIAMGAKPIEADGLAKSVAARVMSVAQGGQTLMTAEARAAFHSPALSVLDHGHWQAKGMPGPIQLFEVRAADAPFMQPLPNDKMVPVVRAGELWLPLSGIKHSLPAERDAFVGRHAAMRVLRQQFDEGARLVCVTGIGGTGKTRLAQRFGWTLLRDFPGGVWFCDLSQARNLEGICHAVAQGLSLPLGRVDPLVQIGHALDGRGRCLVVLDNFEQVRAFAEQTVGQWLERAPAARFMVTTREVLGISGEEVLALSPMAPDEAATLFRRRAEAVRHNFEPTASDQSAIGPLVRLLDGLPLAIELAAARVRLMSPRALLERMSERFSLLTSSGGRPDRQATLRATLDWSWDLLTLPERAALAQLTVCEGGFTLEAAEAIIDLQECDAPPSRLDAIQSLIEKSLLRPRSQSRFELLGMVQEYANEHLHCAGHFPGSGPSAQSQARMRHGSFFASMGVARAIADACADLGNLVAATRHTAAQCQVGEAVAALEAAWAALRLQGPFRVGVELAELVRAVPNLDRASVAHVERVLGWAWFSSGRMAEAGRHFEAALIAARGAGDRICEGHVLGHLGQMHGAQGRADDGVAELTMALGIAAECRQPLLECEARLELGNLCERLGRLDQARAHYETALAVARATRDRRWEGGCLGNLGILSANQGRLAEAQIQYEAALAVARELGDRQWEGNTRCNLGLLHHVMGHRLEARTELELALSVARAMGYLRLETGVLCNLGMVEEGLAQPDMARSHYEAAVAVARRLADQRTEGQVLGYLGLLHARQRRVDEGRTCLEAGEALLTRACDPLNLAILLCSRAECEHLGGCGQAALAAYASAEKTAREVDASPESELGQSLSRVAAMLADHPPGRAAVGTEP